MNFGGGDGDADADGDGDGEAIIGDIIGEGEAIMGDIIGDGEAIMGDIIGEGIGDGWACATCVALNVMTINAAIDISFFKVIPSGNRILASRCRCRVGCAEGSRTA